MKTEIISGSVEEHTWSLQYRLGVYENNLIEGVYVVLFFDKNPIRITAYPTTPWNSGNKEEFRSSLEKYGSVFEEESIDTDRFSVWEHFSLWDDLEILSKEKLIQKIMYFINENMR